MRVKLIIQVIALDSNNTHDEGDVICTLQTALNGVQRPKTSLEIKGDNIIWMEEMGGEQKFSDVPLVKAKK